MSLILVTGANGFIGRPLCEELLYRGHRVRAAVRSPTRMPEGVEAIEAGDIDGTTDWTVALQGVDTIIHLAARVHVMKETSTDPLAEFLKVNLHGTENLARQAVHAGVKRFVYASSIKVNGEQTAGTQSFSENNQTDPQDHYGVSKWQAEQALHRIANETGLEIVIVRPPLVYGPGVKGNFIRLLGAIDKGTPLPLAGAHNARSMIYVGNLVDALIACATHSAAAEQTYLVSDGEDVSTARLANKIAIALGRGSSSFYFPPCLLRVVARLLGRAEQMDRLFGSLRINDEKIRSELAWIPPYTMEQGLHITADWYHSQRNGYNHGTS